jgi:hypothetical protein
MPQISGLFAGKEASEWRRARYLPIFNSPINQSGGADGPNKTSAESPDQECAACGYFDAFGPVRYEGTVSRHSRSAQL